MLHSGIVAPYLLHYQVWDVTIYTQDDVVIICVITCSLYPRWLSALIGMLMVATCLICVSILQHNKSINPHSADTL